MVVLVLAGRLKFEESIDKSEGLVTQYIYIGVVNK
jgi:hypothetical protein